jgi:hypothetical protein
MLFVQAGVAELADAPGLGPGGLRPLEVQVLSPAQCWLRKDTGRGSARCPRYDP